MIPETLAELVVPIETLRPYERNPRRGNLEAIKASLEAHGQYRPVVARTNGEVLAGNHTLAAALELGWTQLAVTYVDVDDEQAARIVLVDNRSSDLAVYDKDELTSLLRSLPELEGTGWDPTELDQLLAELDRDRVDALRDTEPGPPPPTARTQLGDVWQLGEHRLICGDATDSEVAARLLDGAEPILLATDPPYGVLLDMEWRDRAGLNAMAPMERSYMKSVLGKVEGRPGTAGPSGITGDTEADWSRSYELVPSLTVAYVWHSGRRAAAVAAGLQRIDFQCVQQIVWVKSVFVLSRQHYHWQHECCWYARRTGAKVNWLGGRKQSTVWNAASPKHIMGGSAEEREPHPTQKPLDLYVRPIQNHLRPGEMLYDPFVGSGTAIIAAENTNTVCFACELDPIYCDVTVDRWQRHTGLKAKRERRRAHAAA